jgi:hypothetical protein
LLVAEVLPPVVTVTSTVPLLSDAGQVAVICVSLFTVYVAAFNEPKETLLALVKPVPVMVTVVALQAIGPLFGSTFVTTGAGGGDGQIVDSVALCPEVLLTVSLGFEQ